MKDVFAAPCLGLAVLVFFTMTPAGSRCFAASPLESVKGDDVLLVADQTGHILFEKNRTKRFVPASILKIFTALAAFHYLGPSYRFETELYWGPHNTLKVKGYGDPLLISEVWTDMARMVAEKKKKVDRLLLDDSYFQRDISIPGSGRSTNPYDAPIGALCANFNTVFFKRDHSGHILSAEPQTPITPLARKRIGALREKKGRYTFSHQHDDIVLYAGELFAYFLQKNGVHLEGDIVSGKVDCQDPLLFTYTSPFTVEETVQKMLKYSNNFLANQMVVAIGAREFGPPGTLAKGVQALTYYGRTILRLKAIQLVEGSGISRNNQLSANDMLTILKAFEPYRHLLVRDGPVQYKTGTLTGLRTRAGYIEDRHGNLYSFVVSLKNSSRMKKVITAVKKAVLNR